MVVCTGSIAYDYILNFTGRFREHILPDKTHILNLSFLVDDLHKRRGGVAGNYAYNLSLLGYPAAVLATAGADAAEYRAWVEERGIDCRGLRLMDGEITATGFTTTDMDDNQITGYYGGAMRKAAILGLDDAPSEVEAVVIGPNDPAAMMRLSSECRERGVRFVFDPAHQQPHAKRWIQPARETPIARAWSRDCCGAWMSRRQVASHRSRPLTRSSRLARRSTATGKTNSLSDSRSRSALRCRPDSSARRISQRCRDGTPTRRAQRSRQRRPADTAHT